MTLGYGIGLGTIGIILTIIGFAIAYHYGSKPKPKKQDKGLIYLKVRIGKVDIVKLDLFKK